MIKPIFLISIIFGSLILSGCKKQNSDTENTCQNIKNATLFSNSPVVIGHFFLFGTQEVGGYRIYSWNGPENFHSQYPKDSIEVQLKNEGWYYLTLYSANGQCQKNDSVYLDVKLQQGTPVCKTDINTTTYNNLSADKYTIVKKYIEPNLSQKSLYATGGMYSNMTIYFHTHWRTAEPEDGIYFTTNTPVFDQADNNYNKVFITTTKSSIYFGSNEGQIVYVSHVNSKLQLRFCNIIMGGNNYNTSASGNLVEL